MSRPVQAPAIDWTPARDVVGAYRVGHSAPNGHPADGMTAQVDLGGGAFSSILNPRPFAEGGLIWSLTWWPDTSPLSHVAASVLGSYDYLLSDAITMKEAAARLRLLRKARAALASPVDGGGGEGK